MPALPMRKRRKDTRPVPDTFGEGLSIPYRGSPFSALLRGRRAGMALNTVQGTNRTLRFVWQPHSAYFLLGVAAPTPGNLNNTMHAA